MTPARDPEVLRRRRAKHRLAQGANCGVFAAGIAILIASQASATTDPQFSSLLALMTVLAVAPGVTLVVVNSLALKTGRSLEGPRTAAAGAGGLALGLLVAVTAVAVVSREADTLAFAFVAAIVPGIEVVLAGATVAALRRPHPADVQQQGHDAEPHPAAR